MEDLETLAPTTEETLTRDRLDQVTDNWSSDAPRG
jgi:hypothetical protein